MNFKIILSRSVLFVILSKAKLIIITIAQCLITASLIHTANSCSLFVSHAALSKLERHLVLPVSKLKFCVTCIISVNMYEFWYLCWN